MAAAAPPSLCSGCAARASSINTSSLLAFLKAVPAQEAGVPGAVVCIASNESISDALLQMSLHGVLALPVVNIANSQTIAIVDMQDIVSYVVDHTRQFFKAKGEAAICVEKLLAEWALPNLVKVKIEEVCNYSGANAFHFLPPTASIWEVVELMQGKHVHRVALREESGRLAGLVTQSTLIKYLANHKPILRSLLTAKIGGLPGATTHMLVSVSDDKTAFAAFDTMHKEKVSAVAVTDSAGRLRSVVSNRDLKQIGTSAQAFDSLYKSVIDYVQGEQSWRKIRDLFSYSVITYKSDETFEAVLDRVVQNRVHRLYLTDDSGRPVGVLSLGDMIRQIRHAALHP